jgi:hypothetical protein
MAVWTRTRGVALAIGLAALLPGCTREATPVPILGTWYSNDPRFEDRRLEIEQRSIRFMRGGELLGSIQVRDVRLEGRGEGPIRVEIAGVDREGLETTLVFELQQRPTELLRLETQRETWRRGRRFIQTEGMP